MMRIPARAPPAAAHEITGGDSRAGGARGIRHGAGSGTVLAELWHGGKEEEEEASVWGPLVCERGREEEETD